VGDTFLRVDQEGLVIAQADDTAVRCISGDRCFYSSLSSPYLGYDLDERQRMKDAYYPARIILKPGPLPWRKEMRARLLCLDLLVAGVLGLIATAVAKVPPPSGTLTIATTSVAVGIGVNWGTGVLTTNGQRYPFAVQGLEVGGVGVSKVQAVGQVYHLRKVEDFIGTYVAVRADAAVGGGAGILTMRNHHGVVINLQSVQQGFKLTAGVEGITIMWKGRRGRL
jgi:hypothetical protein